MQMRYQAAPRPERVDFTGCGDKRGNTSAFIALGSHVPWGETVYIDVTRS
jgi:hypothetical protein